MKELVYNVFREDFNARKIVIYNIFNHSSFYEDLLKIKKKSGDDFESFSEAVKGSLMHHFWSRSEHEVVVTSWPTYVDAEEVSRLIKERDERLKNYKNFYREYVNLTIGEKFDIYDQVLLNWEIFIKYLWENRALIKRRAR